MKRRSGSLCLALALLVTVLSSVWLPAAAAAEPAVTGGTVTAVTRFGELPRGDSLITGKIPYIGDKSNTLDGDVTSLYAGQAAALTDGLVQGLHTIATDETVTDGMAAVTVAQNAWSGSYNGWGDHVWLIYDLGERRTVESLLIANSLTGVLDEAEENVRFVRSGEIYIADTRSAAVNAAALVMSFDYSDAGQAPAVLRLTPEAAATGRYVAFHFVVPNETVFSETGNQRYRSVRLSELGVYAPAEPEPTATVSGGTVTAVTVAAELPAGDSLIAGKIPNIGHTNNTLDGATTSLYTGRAAALTDGTVQGVTGFATVETVEEGMAAVGTAGNAWNGSYNGWGNQVWLVYDLGESRTIDTLLIANSLLGDAASTAASARFVRSGEVYVADTRGEAVNAAALVMSFDYRDAGKAPAVLKLTLDAAATGRFVAFHFALPNEAVFSETGLNDGNGNYKNKTARLSELGVYAPAGTETIDWQDAPTGQWAAAAENSLVWQWENRLAGLSLLRTDGTALRMTGTEFLADGQLNAAPDRALVSGNGLYDWWAPLTFDLGEEYALERFLVAGGYEDAAYAPHRVKIYVSDTRETLYDAASLAVDSGAMERTGKQWQLRPAAGTVTGRYVGFSIYVPDADVSTELCFDDAGNKLYANWWGGIRLGELGVYGEATGQPLTPEKPMKTVVCVGDSVTEGVWDDSGRLYGDKRSYPQQLAELLNTEDAAYSYAVVNAGYGGNALVSATAVGSTTENGWMELHPEEIVAADYVLIALGGNDAPYWGKNRDTYTDLYREQYRALVAAFREKNPTVQIFLLSPQYMKTRQHKDIIEAEILAVQRELAEELGLSFVDDYTATKRFCAEQGEDAYFTTPTLGIHCSEAGLGVIARNVYRAMTSATRVLGAQRRLDDTADGTAALRFGMAVDCTGVTVGDGYAAVYAEDSTITIADTAYRLVGMGGVAAVADKLTDAENQLVQGGSGVKTVPAAKLYAAGDGRAYFTVTVVHIPENAYDRLVAVRPYAVYAAADGTEIVVYGNIQYACVNDFPLE